MGTQANAAPVIIKRKKVVSGDGHHGGAWKVAYADFVTAMMAFFMLMWLLNATTEKQRKGIADYFSPTLAMSRVSGGGEGAFGGESAFSENTLPQNGTGATDRFVSDGQRARGEFGVEEQGKNSDQEDAALRELEHSLMGRGGESMFSLEQQRHMITRVTDEGLIVELFDLEDSQLFNENTDQPTPLLEALAKMMVRVFGIVSNKVAVEGHTRAYPIVLRENPVWSLSAARADKMRLLLQDMGLKYDRVQRVTGHADRELAVKDPTHVRNNRLEVVLLRSQRR